MPPVEQELPTLPDHPSSPPVFSRVRVARSLVFCVVFCRSLFVLFIFAIVLSVLRFTDSDYPFGIFKLFKQLFFCILPRKRHFIAEMAKELSNLYYQFDL
jgi:hypothetical protein